MYIVACELARSTSAKKTNKLLNKCRHCQTGAVAHSVGAPRTSHHPAWHSNSHPPAIPAPTTTTSLTGRSMSCSVAKVDAAAVPAPAPDDAGDSRDGSLLSISTTRLALLQSTTFLCKATMEHIGVRFTSLQPRCLVVHAGSGNGRRTGAEEPVLTRRFWRF